MIRNLRPVGVLAITMLLTVVLGSSVLAFGRPVTAPYPIQERVTPPPASAGSSSTNSPAPPTPTPKPSPTPKVSQAATPPVSGTPLSTVSGTVAEQLSTTQLEVCQQRAVLIGVIMKRTVTRDQNQLTLFTNIASKVENFYSSKGKTTAGYPQLVSNVNAYEAQAEAGLTALQENAAFSCEGNNPSGEVSVYQTDFKTLQTSMQNLQAAIKNLIVAVAQAEGYSLSSSATKGGQQ